MTPRLCQTAAAKRRTELRADARSTARPKRVGRRLGREFGGAKFASREIERGETTDDARWLATAARKLFSSEPSCGIRGGAGRDDAGDFARTIFLAILRVFHLVADGDLEALADQLGDVALGRVVGHAAHGNGDALFLVARGQRDLQLARRDDGVLEKQLVEVAQAKKQQRVGMLFLDGSVLPHQRRGRLGHRRQNCADYNSRNGHRFARQRVVLHCVVLQA